jgi:hypothetical protein
VDKQNLQDVCPPGLAGWIVCKTPPRWKGLWGVEVPTLARGCMASDRAKLRRGGLASGMLVFFLRGRALAVQLHLGAALPAPGAGADGEPPSGNRSASRADIPHVALLLMSLSRCCHNGVRPSRGNLSYAASARKCGLMFVASHEPPGSHGLGGFSSPGTGPNRRGSGIMRTGLIRVRVLGTIPSLSSPHSITV